MYMYVWCIYSFLGISEFLHWVINEVDCIWMWERMREEKGEVVELLLDFFSFLLFLKERFCSVAYTNYVWLDYGYEYD